MHRKHFETAAALVRSIASGGWTFDTPAWAGPTLQPTGQLRLAGWPLTDADLNYTRAVWTAEAFILLFSPFNPRFNRDKFLVACGLVTPARQRTA